MDENRAIKNIYTLRFVRKKHKRVRKMIRQCEEHGYFRGELCPVCGSEGKFILNDYETEKLGKTLAGALRHFPEKFELTMDPKGWVDVRQFVNALRSRQRRFKWLRPYHIAALISTDPKGRYQYKDGYIRATYAHTIDVDLDLPTDGIPDTIYYPATEEEKELLLETGLRPSSRTFVHMSATLESAVEAGKVRTPSPVVFEIDVPAALESGIVIMHAAPNIFITKDIPPEFIREVEVPEELLEVEEDVPQEVKDAEEKSGENLDEEEIKEPPKSSEEEDAEELEEESIDEDADEGA